MTKKTITLSRKKKKIIKAPPSIASRLLGTTNDDTKDNDTTEYNGQTVFDPRVKFNSFEDEKNARVVWQAESIKLAEQAMDEGTPLKVSPFFKNNPNLRQGGLLYKFNKEEKAEFRKCKYDIIYFAEKYVKLLNNGKESNIKLRPYQKRILVSFQRNKFTIILSGRQIGKTTTTAIFSCWMLLFHSQINMALVGDKLQTSTENLNKCKDILNALPFFLKPGVISWNVRSIVFDNRSKCMTAPCNKGALVGKTIHVLYIDELAIPKANLSKELVEYALPTLQSIDHAKFIASSTPSGDNIFKTLWVNAINGVNQFNPIQVNWWEVPKRDADWVRREIANTSIDAFNEQFNCMFLSSTNSLYSHDTIQELEQGLMSFEPIEPDQIPVKLANLTHRLGLRKGTKGITTTEKEPINFFSLREDIDINELKNEYCIFEIDIAEGILQDFSVINIFRLRRSDKEVIDSEYLDQYEQPTNTNIINYEDDGFGYRHRSNFDEYDDEFRANSMLSDGNNLVEETPFNENIYAEQIGLFHSNCTSIELVALFTRALANTLFNQERLKIVPEMNKYGSHFLMLLLNERNPDIEIDYDTIGRTMRNGKQEMGVYMSSKTKNMYVKSSKLKIESGEIVITEKRTLDEIKYFGERPNGSFGASSGYHDDIAMTCVGISAYIDINNDDYSVFIEDMDLVDDIDEDYTDMYNMQNDYY